MVCSKKFVTSRPNSNPSLKGKIFQNFLQIHYFFTRFIGHVFSQNFKEYSRDFEFGIFQSIGFKEFDDYFNYLDKGKDNSDADYEEKKDVLFKKGIDEMKISTRRYAKTQIKWVKNVFVKSMFVK